MSKPNLTSKEYIADLHNALKRLNKEQPDIMAFLEYFCGYNAPVLSSDPATISYSAGKRDVILTIKTIMRDDVDPEAIAKMYERIL